MFRHKTGEPVKILLEYVKVRYELKSGLNPWQWLETQKLDKIRPRSGKLKAYK
jgi:hypothetical protein